MSNWLKRELSGCKFKDKRLSARFESIIGSLIANQGKSIPQAFQEWGATKAVYRFLSNDRVEESEIFKGHFEQTHERISNNSGPTLILYDTTEFSYKRKNPELIGYTRKNKLLRKLRSKIPGEYKVCGILMHTSLVVTTDGLPLGLASARFWSRSVFKGTEELKRHVNPTRIPIEEKESIKWLKNLDASMSSVCINLANIIHIGDRENDIYEFFTNCISLGTMFLVRACVNRLANETTISEEMASKPHNYNHRIEFRTNTGEKIKAKLNIKTKRLLLHPPIGKEKNQQDIEVTVISATEGGEPVGRKKLRWVLLTNLPVNNKVQAIKTLEWYKQRWRIEDYFKILKSGLKTEESKLRSATGLSKLISMCCILAWRIQWLTLLNRQAVNLEVDNVFNPEEITVFKTYFKKENPSTLSDYIILLAKLGGYLNRKNDPPPGYCTVWRGFNKLFELCKGFQLAKIVGN